MLLTIACIVLKCDGPTFAFRQKLVLVVVNAEVGALMLAERPRQHHAAVCTRIGLGIARMSILIAIDRTTTSNGHAYKLSPAHVKQ